jgi:transcription elongation factor
MPSLHILSAFAVDSFPGRIYIESRDLQSVSRAIDNLVNVYRNSLTVIPVTDREWLLNHKSRTSQAIIPWAILHRGMYKGDLALVKDAMHVDVNGDSLITDIRTVAVIPRINLEIQSQTSRKQSRSSPSRPPRHLFDPSMIRRIYGEDSLERKKDGSFVFQNRTFRDSLLEMRVHGVHALEYVHPSQDKIGDLLLGIIHKMDKNQLLLLGNSLEPINNN